jgi:hypothetical protein
LLSLDQSQSQQDSKEAKSINLKVLDLIMVDEYLSMCPARSVRRFEGVKGEQIKTRNSSLLGSARPNDE